MVIITINSDINFKLDLIETLFYIKAIILLPINQLLSAR